MESEVPIRLVLVDPPAGVDFGIQKGRGIQYETLFVQRRTSDDIVFDFFLTVKDNRADGLPNFLGPLAQGTPEGRFVYVDVGTLAGQKDGRWSRRMKVPLQGLTWALLGNVLDKPGHVLRAKIRGTGTDGSPSCGSVKLLGGWDVLEARRTQKA